MQHSLLEVVGNIHKDHDMLSDIAAVSFKSNLSNIDKLSHVIQARLDQHIKLKASHDSVFDVCKAVADHKCELESVLASTLNKLVLNTFKVHKRLELQRPKLELSNKVIKHTTKPVVKKDVELPRQIVLSHLKFFCKGVVQSVQRKSMVLQHVPAPVINQALGPEIPHFADSDGAASDDIWGPVV